MSETDSGHPVFKGLERLEGVSFYQAVHVTPSKDAQVLARLNDQTPLLLERQIGEGKVLVFTSTFDNSSERPAGARRLLGAVRAAIGDLSGRRRSGAAGERSGGLLRRVTNP